MYISLYIYLYVDKVISIKLRYGLFTSSKNGPKTAPRQPKMNSKKPQDRPR